MNKTIAFPMLLLSALVAASLSSCDNGGGGGGGGNSKRDFGDNDPNKVVCLGDSITDGGCVPAGAPYPARLASLSGKNVINAGSCGERTGEGASRVGSLLGTFKPGFLCILEGANDATRDNPTEEVVANLRSMVQAAKNNKTIPLIATLTPVYDGHGFASGNVKAISAGIRTMAKEEGVRVVDLEKEFDAERSFIQEDGLHPSDSGTQLIALSFNDKI